MKEISLQELLNMADPAAHDGIVDLWNQKAIHYLVLFTSPDQDFEIIGAGPTLPCATLDDAGKHSIPGKSPELYVKCPAAIAGKIQPKLAPSHLATPKGGGATPRPVPPAPTLKGKTSLPFAKPGLKLTAPGSAPTAAAASAEPPPSPPPAVSKSEASAPAPAVPAPASSASGEADARAAALTRREKELAALAESLKIRESSVRQREEAVAAREAKLAQGGAL